jgi:beta-galactosidase
MNRTFLAVFCAALLPAVVQAETYYPQETNRVKINLGATPWKFTKGDVINAQNPTLNDTAWSTVGVPHTWSDTESFNNQSGGGATGSMYGGVSWYRKHFTLDNSYNGRKLFVEIEGAHLGAAVYINGTFLPGNDGINTNATHVVGFIGFVVDITPYARFGGTDNVLAVKVSGNGGFFTYPGFSIDYRFGQGDYGLFRPVWLHVTDNVHVPLNVYSVINQWGTYVATVSATDASATIRIQTNVRNDNASAQTASVTTKVVDAAHNVVLSMDADAQSIGADTNLVFDQTGTIANPTLWYPAGSPYGTPYMYKVYHIVKVGGNVTDVFDSPLGIRVITWDHNFPYINGRQHYMWGVSSRYDYPALGTAVPEEQQWRDAKLAAECSADLWRPGHSSSSPEFVDACDAYGVMLVQPSGELEGTFSTNQLNPTKQAYKTQLHRDMIIRDRNHPSVLSWEVSNGPIDAAFAGQLKTLSQTWDPVNTRAQSDRGGSAADLNSADIISCSSSGCEISMKNGRPNTPCWGAEAWGGRRSARFAWDYEIAFAGQYLQNWKKSRQANCFGLAQWYLTETPGEAGNFLEGVGEANVRSFGSSMMDFNRIPKLLYYAYQAAWTPYSVKPVVALAHHWNRSGAVQVNAFSNCPSVRLRINGADQGTKTPNPWQGTGDGSDQNTTQLPFQCSWNVTWTSGTLRAEGLDAGGAVVCSDERKTAATPDHIVLTVEPELVRPDGDTFHITANGTDAAFILATVVDENGIWCPTANNLVTFNVAGPGNYRGGSDQYVTAGKPINYHSPLDHELSAEGGMCKIAVRSTFQTGTVTVMATSAGLGQGTASFTVYPVPIAYTTAVPIPGTVPAVAFAAKVARVRFCGNSVRYFLTGPADISLEILNAAGRVVRMAVIPAQIAGWHALKLDDTRGAGVYFVRCRLAGVSEGVYRMAVVK